MQTPIEESSSPVFTEHQRLALHSHLRLHHKNLKYLSLGHPQQHPVHLHLEFHLPRLAYLSLPVCRQHPGLLIYLEAHQLAVREQS